MHSLFPLFYMKKSHRPFAPEKPKKTLSLDTTTASQEEEGLSSARQQRKGQTEMVHLTHNVTLYDYPST
jgi:hypothetical protein